MRPELKNRVQTRIPTCYGEFTLHYYSNNLDNKEHIAFVKGKITGLSKVLVRLHSECFTGDVLGSRRCDCGEQLDMAMQLIGQAGFGVLIYLRQEGRGIGLLKKLQAYNLQDQGLDTVDANIHLGHLADERDYSVAAMILNDLGVSSIQLITNNPHKIDGLKHLGIDVEQRIAIEPDYHHENLVYLKAKAEKMSHLLSFTNTGRETLPSHLHFIAPLIARLDQQPAQPSRPFVTLNYSQSTDASAVNKLVMPASLNADLMLSQVLRSHHDAVLVDISAVINYDLDLNVADHQIGDFQLVILDYSLRFPENSALLQTSTKRPIIYTSLAALSHQHDGKLSRLMQRGVRFISVDGIATDQLDITAVLASLADLHIHTLVVEGGGDLVNQFLYPALADYCFMTLNIKSTHSKKIIEKRCQPIFHDGCYDCYYFDSSAIAYGVPNH